jgi:hypothetical protein
MRLFDTFGRDQVHQSHYDIVAMAPRGYFQKEGKVSLWICLRKPNLPAERDVDILKTWCGVLSYDLDQQELSGADNSFPLTKIADLLKPISYSSSFLDAAMKATDAKKLTEAYWILAQFDFAYDPKKTVGKVRADPMFLGAFDWNDSEDDLPEPD